MSIETAQVDVADTATALHTADQGAPLVVLVENQGSASMFIGDSTVTTSTGYELEAGQHRYFNLSTGEVLYGIVASGTEQADVFANRAFGV